MVHADQVLLVFDGNCGFCQTCVNLGRRLLPYMPLVRAWQSIPLETIGLTREQAATSVQLVGPRGLHAQGARAIAVVLALQPTRGWRALGRTMLLPPVSWLAEAVYRVVARYRTRLPGAFCLCA
ncbi:hypothetical protein TBS_36460 [Thermobispora bispora]|jgi:predicted DCC family thiol-disulfide oxidoreductase YuxK|uniref:Putative thiol-disulfide oxidoreductase DCC n=1 Tax=Thermobispora bispora (strain ATCC 19993 / DSM 43833 / CBS 139.67 / JCM 10125 / KCTC 9307 / NBRC 14880 / R51) TaxID=469371 RepID=D6Y582_THEBD|nr:DUF393 domain-containing protein [Thermobispora bispora]ADG89277.1 putative thiol-disulfide oxidoreductase DCC [Thermobispora bispora DSM 43833]MBO2473643.1 DUF393 domain-containing protein [Actinomycetales bacterium]MBX6167223.1 DUF393 domain-containing protein [Thermobispora bispora]QSI48952.1 DUF393 domain-containing protein [Thermobispora bispora]